MRLRLLTIAGLLAVAAAMTSVGLAAAPRGNANYIAVDAKGRPAITLWMQTSTKMLVFVCYRWGHVADEGDHYNNVEPITVSKTGWFAYDGAARSLKGVIEKLTVRGHFESKDVAVGRITAPCMHAQPFTAHYSAH